MHILGKGLVERGHQVSVVTGFPNYPEGRIYPGYRQRLCQREEIDGVRIFRLPLFPDRSRSALRRSANYLSFAASASLLGPAVSGPTDVMLVYHPPSTLGIPAWLISSLRRVPFVYEIQDMWPETLPATGMVRNPFILNALTKLSTFTYRRAAAITVISPGFKRSLVQKGVPEQKIHVVLNWGYEGAYKLVPPDEGLAREWGMLGRFNVVYAGNMGPAQGLHNVLEAARLLTDCPAIQFVLLGHGVDRADLEERVRAKQIPNVRFLPAQPMECMPSVYALADALLIHLVNDPLFEITIPGKTQSYLASGRPLLVAVSGDAADLVLEAGAGVAARPSDPADLARAVRELYARPPEQRQAMGMAGRKYYLENLAPNILIDRYEHLLLELVQCGSSS
jgi:glycosyltransferase involved in cell wall biosynthesis